MKQSLFRLEPVVQHYAWGSPRSSSIVADLASHAVQKGDLPYAELWIGAHPNGCARVLNSGRDESLAELCARDGVRLLGHAKHQRWEGQIPFLLKVLSIGSPLSIQLHPKIFDAEILHRRDPSHYPDANHKPEVAIALTPLKLLCGFRAIDEFFDLEAECPELVSLLPAKAIEEISSDLDFMDLLERVAQTIFLRLSDEQVAKTTLSIKRRIEKKESLTPHQQLFLHCIDPSRPEPVALDDRGLLFLFVMQLVTVAPGEAIFIDPNVAHAYISGDIIECMANSDNVVRAGLTRKYQDRETLCQLLSYSMTLPATLDPLPLKGIGHGFYPPVEEFSVEYYTVIHGQAVLDDHSGCRLMLVLSGSLTLVTGAESLDLERGGAVCIAADASPLSIRDAQDASFVIAL
jgi:mannose-6-phosphate isomerase